MFCSFTVWLMLNFSFLYTVCFPAFVLRQEVKNNQDEV